MEEAQKKFLIRLFPEIQLEGDDWRQDFENKIKTFKLGSKSNDNDDVEEGRQLLEKQVVHYKTSLQETISLKALDEQDN